MKYVLDTNIVARLLDGDGRALSRLASVAAEDVGIPLVVLAELLFGVEKSSRREVNRIRVERFAAGVQVLAFDRNVAERYAVVRADVERKGRPKSDFDLIVACTALEHGATLVTNDRGLKDDAIPDLLFEDWIELEAPG